MKDTPKPDKRRKYDAAFRAEALRLAEQSRSAQAAARALNIDPKRIYQWPKRQWRRHWALT
jgi:transposase